MESYHEKIKLDVMKDNLRIPLDFMVIPKASTDGIVEIIENL